MKNLSIMAIAAAATLVLGSDIVSAQDAIRAKPKTDAKQQVQPQRPPLKPVVQDFRKDYRFRHRWYPQTKKPTTIGKAFEKIVRLEAVADGVAKVRLPASKATLRARQGQPAFGFYLLNNKLSARQLRKMVGQDIRVKVQSDRTGHLTILEYGVPR